LVNIPQFWNVDLDPFRFRIDRGGALTRPMVLLVTVRSGKHLVGVPIRDGDQTEKPTPDWQIGYVRAPDLVRTIHPQPPEQVGKDLVASSGLLVSDSS